MKNTTLLLAFFSILLFLPLAHDLGRYGFFGGALWNDNGFLMLLFFFVSFIFFGVQKKYSLNSFGVLLLATLSALIFINVGEHGIFFSHFSAWARYSAFILLPLFFFQTIRSANRFYIGFLFIGLVVLQAQWGLLQFIFQHDLGFTFLGEPHLTVGTNGVAKFMVQGTKIIRAYGPYLHPNALAASLLAGLQMCAFLIINFEKKEKSEYSGTTIYITFTAFFIFLALLLTFSRASLLGFGLLVFAYAFLNLLLSFRVGVAIRQPVRTLALPLLTALLVLSPLLYSRTVDKEDKAASERARGYVFLGRILEEASIKTVLTGVGIGMYPETAASFLTRSKTTFAPWEVSPFHNSVILFLVEMGVIGVLICGALLALFLRTQKLTMWYWAWLLLPMVPIALSDHHFLTSSGSFVMWEVLALLTYELAREASYQVFIRKKRVMI